MPLPSKRASHDPLPPGSGLSSAADPSQQSGMGIVDHAPYLQRAIVCATYGSPAVHCDGHTPDSTLMPLQRRDAG
eukprot:scaffold57515_cov18-Prasinocladus_malaysianus.AAC.1